MKTMHGAVNPGVIVLLVGGAALFGLLVYGFRSGHELPLWPALLVALVNVLAALKLAADARRKRQGPPRGEGS